MSKIKKWHKITIIIIVVLLAIIVSLKVFKKPILKHILTQEELIVYDAYQKSDRIIDYYGFNYDLKRIDISYESNALAPYMTIHLAFQDKSDELILYYYYNNESSIHYIHGAISSPTNVFGEYMTDGCKISIFNSEDDFCRIDDDLQKRGYIIIGQRDFEKYDYGNDRFTTKIKLLDFIF